MKLRKIALVIAAIMIVMTIAGCQKNEENLSEKTKVTVWTRDGGGKDMWTKLVSKFNDTVGKEKGVEIEWVTYASDYNTVVDVARQNDQLPDIFQLTDNQRIDYMKKGDIISLDDIDGGKALIDEYDTIKVNNINYFDDKCYGFFSDALVTGLIYNKDLFKNAGIVDENGDAKPPKTLDEVREYAKLITDEANSVYGYSYPLKFGTYYTIIAPLQTSYGEDIYDYDKLEIDVSSSAKKLAWIKELKDDGSIFPGPESLDNDTSRAYFAEGKIGMMAGMSWDVGVLTSQFVAKCDWGVVPFPTETGDAEYPAWTSIGGQYNISKNASKIPADKLLEVYKFIYSVDVRKAMYEEGISISCKEDILDVADSSKIPQQFEEFAKLYSRGNTSVPQRAPALVLDGETIDEVWNKLWDGEITADEAVADLNKRMSAALKNGVEKGDIDVELYR